MTSKIVEDLMSDDIKKLTQDIVALVDKHGARTRMVALAIATATCIAWMNEDDMKKTQDDVGTFATLVWQLYREIVANISTEIAIEKAIKQAKEQPQQPN